ncbi:hypothetical protein TI39_contig831g00012 [Zymoseptoria brevis]|uniref:Uncharacterized protein n=1 Tax=Zymoseptoria brevis TaxID=1047168 RepID=A0A0F4GIW4_9PEZI|nr:hypothetical protein TI39_contig831g00012 [Zymoseptoria brevis]
MAASHMDAAPRRSTDTAQRHLLAESIAPSESASQRDMDFSGELTPRAQSPARTLTDQTTHVRNVRPYRGFASEAEYLAALNAWAESKKYVQQESNLVGFYGHTTVEELANRPRIQFGISKLLKGRKEKKKAKQGSTK